MAQAGRVKVIFNGAQIEIEASDLDHMRSVGAQTYEEFDEALAARLEQQGAEGQQADPEAQADLQGGDEAPGFGEPSAPVYDPSEYSVEQVQAYLAEHPEQTDAVLAAERTGKARKTLVGEGES